MEKQTNKQTYKQTKITHKKVVCLVDDRISERMNEQTQQNTFW